jgi:hypothetical protein
MCSSVIIVKVKISIGSHAETNNAVFRKERNLSEVTRDKSTLLQAVLFLEITNFS